MPFITRAIASLILFTMCLEIVHGGETITITGTIEKIDLSERTLMILTRDNDQKIDLELTRKTKIKRGSESVGPDVIKAGDQATIQYDSDLLAAIIIELGTTGPTEALNLEELNTPENESSPCVSLDGLEIFWVQHSVEKGMSIWSARRKNAEGFFTGKKRLFSGHAPVLSADGLELLYRNIDAETISLTTRKSRDEDFGRPRPVSTLTFPGTDAAPRWLTADGLTLYLDMKNTEVPHQTWEVNRNSTKANWSKPKLVKAEFEGKPDGFRFTQVSSTTDNLHLYVCADFPPKGLRVGVLSREQPSGPFTKWQEIPLTNANGQYAFGLKPQFVAETNELFMTSSAFYADVDGPKNRKGDLWVIKDFHPPEDAVGQDK